MCIIVVLTGSLLLGVWGWVQTKEALGILAVSIGVYYVGGIVAAALESE
jgi:hypothetical protein